MYTLYYLSYLADAKIRQKFYEKIGKSLAIFQ